MKIKTNSLEPGEPKDIEGSTLYEIYKAFATPEETATVEKQYAEGIGWGVMKQQLFEYINDHIAPARQEYDRLIADPSLVEAELQKGAARAREVATPYMDQIRRAIGIRSLGATS
jgi:tryptophanyl-tRNA synthetase